MHVVHVSSARVLPMLAEAKRSGVRITAETCPHYLTFAAEDIPDGATQFAACPPIRDEDNRGLLWQGLADGTLDMIVSDHSPCAPSMKAGGDFGSVFGGISSLELGPRAVWTHAAERGFGLAELCRWMAERPAALAGLTDRGRIAVGQRADLCAFDPDVEQTVHAGRAAPPARGHALRRGRAARLGGADLVGGPPSLRAGGPAGMKILVLNPNTSESMTAEIAAAAACGRRRRHRDRRAQSTIRRGGDRLGR